MADVADRSPTTETTDSESDSGTPQDCRNQAKIITLIKHMEDKGLDALILPESFAKEPDTFRVEGYKVIHSADAQKDDKGNQFKPSQE